jgi:hypothetical protein
MLSLQSLETRRKCQRRFKAKRRAERIAEGTCEDCGKRPARDSKRTCHPCADTRARYHRNKKIKVIEEYGGTCACCGDNTIEFLTIDHINGGGGKHRKSLNITSGASFYDWLIRNDYPSGYRVLCMNCNGALGFYGYCPHERKLHAVV